LGRLRQYAVHPRLDHPLLQGPLVVLLVVLATPPRPLALGLLLGLLAVLFV
jgi:hypothetical protein